MFVKSNRNVTVVFMLLGEQDWLVYIDQMPEINSQGNTPNQALQQVLKKLDKYDLIHCDGWPSPANKFSFRVSTINPQY